VIRTHFDIIIVGNMNKSIFICRFCGKECKNSNSLTQHENRCYENPNRIVENKLELEAYEKSPKICPICGCIIPYKKRHQKTCSPECGNTLRSESAKKTRSFDNIECICKYCGKICKNDNSLRNHERLCKSNPNRQILVSNFIQWNEYRRGKKLQKSSNQYIKAKEIGVEYTISDETRKKLSKSSSGRVYSKEYKENISKKMKEVAQNNPKYSYSKNKYFKKEIINGFRMDSSWESIFANYLNKNDIKWIKNTKPFKYIFENEEHSYYPDFYLKDFDLYIEVKGHETEKDKAKYKVVDNLLVLRSKEIDEINKNEFDIFSFIKNQ
jgi:hypothetical protein